MVYNMGQLPARGKAAVYPIPGRRYLHLKKSLFGAVAVILVILMAIPFAACKKDQNASVLPAGTDVPVVTGSPDGEVTAGPTATPDQSSADPGYTDVPVVTGSPDGEVTAGPTATPDQSAADPGYTDVPVVTKDPEGSVTAGPTATPAGAPAVTAPASGTAAPTSGTQSPAKTDSPVKTNSPGNTPSPSLPTLPTANPSAFPPTTPKPTNTPKPTPTPKPAQAPGTYIPTPEVPNSYSVQYAGQAVDCSGLSVGKTFFWTLDLVNEDSHSYAAQWLVEYDPEFIEPIEFSATWTGGIIAAINAAYEEDDESSDIPAFFGNLDYVGQSAPNYYGEAGKHYSVVSMALTTFTHGGLNAAGPMVRIKYRVNKLPAASDMQHDGEGYYLPLNIGVISSYAMETPANVFTHGNIEVTPGKLYFKH